LKERDGDLTKGERNKGEGERVILRERKGEKERGK
jgi:hypothetical protein